jgi:hypothetical protein
MLFYVAEFGWGCLFQICDKEKVSPIGWQDGNWVLGQAEHKWLTALGGKPILLFRTAWGLFLFYLPHNLTKVKVKEGLCKEPINY